MAEPTFDIAIERSVEETAWVFETSFIASIICCDAFVASLDTSLKLAFICEVINPAASPALSSESAMLENIMAT